MEQNDQRNVLLAIGLAFVVYLLWSTFILGPQQEQARAAQAARTAAAGKITPDIAAQPIIVAPRERDAIVAEEIAAGTRVALEAPSVNGSISLVGARIDDVALKNYFDTLQDKLNQTKSAEVQVLAPEGADRAFYGVLNWVGATGLPTETTVWTREGTGPLTPTAPLKLSHAGDGVRIDRTIAVDANFMFTVTDTLTNTGAAQISVQPVAVMRQRKLPEHTGPSPQAHQGVIGVYDKAKNQTVKYKDLAKGKGVLEEASSGWIALTTKYWMAAAIPEQGDAVTMRASVLDGPSTFFQAGYTGPTATLAPGQSVTETARIFAGAKQVDVLDQYQKGGIPSFTDAVDWSWLWFITKPFFWMLKIFEGWWGNFGLAILGATVVVKTLFFPMQWKMYESMSKMRKLQPQMQELQKRHADDKVKLQQEMMAMYQREKVNPLSGCLPIIPQMFVFYALYHTLIVTLDMRHAPFFGWVKDMSAPDPTTIFNLFGLLPFNPGAVPFIGTFLMIGIWPILYGITMWALQSMSPPPTDPMQKAIMQWLPLIFLILFAGVAAGLAIYWTWSNIITLVQQYIIMRRQGVETEIDKAIKKYFGKAKPAES